MTQGYTKWYKYK